MHGFSDLPQEPETAQSFSCIPSFRRRSMGHLEEPIGSVLTLRTTFSGTLAGGTLTGVTVAPSH
ncbi:hypothetical protein FOA52_005453 [Chlamydomonas sp. UWO 241]|nr:hypothetical protein FOA52_005453 [Chlamydomonas sp. UWO 241]